jgi:hypothetical protein
MKKEGGCKWYQSIGLEFVNISADFKNCLKDPGPLNNKKRIWTAKQLLMCTDRIMWPPASKIQYRDDTCMISSQYRLNTSIIENNFYNLFIYFRGF